MADWLRASLISVPTVVQRYGSDRTCLRSEKLCASKLSQYVQVETQRSTRSVSHQIIQRIRWTAHYPAGGLGATPIKHFFLDGFVGLAAVVVQRTHRCAGRKFAEMVKENALLKFAIHILDDACMTEPKFSREEKRSKYFIYHVRSLY